MTYLENRMKEIRRTGEGILSLSLAPSGVRDYSDLWYSTGYLKEAGMSQLLIISFVPDSMKLNGLALAEQRMVAEEMAKGSYRDMVFDSFAAVRGKFPDLPLIATPLLGDVLCYGMGRFIQKAKAAGVNGFDVATYQTIEDAAGYRARVEEAGLAFICALGANGLELDNPLHRKTMEGVVRVTSGELFFVPGAPGNNRPLSGAAVKNLVDFIRELQDKYHNRCPIISIGGVTTPGDAYEMVRIAGTDGVHFSSAYMKRRFNGQSREEIQAWIREVKKAMQS